MIRGATIIWKHDRRKTTYSIIGFAVDEEGFPTVVYTPTEEPGKLHTRRCSEFFDGRYRQIEVDDAEEELADVNAMAEGINSQRPVRGKIALTEQAVDIIKRAVAEREIVARRDTRLTRSGE